MSLIKVIGNYHEGTIPHANVRRHEADDALKEYEHLVFSGEQYQKTIGEQAVEIAELQTKLEISQNAYRMAKDRADRMEADNNWVRAVLKTVERLPDGKGDFHCPYCLYKHGHDPECKIGMALIGVGFHRSKIF